MRTPLRKIRVDVAIAFVSLVTITISPSARADDPPPTASVTSDSPPRMPLRFSRRPLTLPGLTLAPSAAFAFSHVSLLGTTSDAAALVGGASYGASDDFEVRAAPLVLGLSPDVKYGNPSAGMTYRFLKGDVEMGGGLGFTYGTGDANGIVVVTPSVPVLVRIGGSVRLDTGVVLPMASGKGDVVGMAIPLAFSFNVTDALRFGLASGAHFASLKGAADSFYVPLTFVTGVAIGGSNGPRIDVDPFFSFPFFARPTSTADKIHTEVWTTGVSVTAYVYL